MNSQRDRLPQRLAEILRRQPLIVKPMPRLVEDAEERVAEILFVIARGHARVARTDPRAKRMGGNVQSTRGEIKTHRGGGVARQLRLRIGGVMTFHALPPRLASPADQ